jgi:GGDEF domain-containing protein
MVMVLDSLLVDGALALLLWELVLKEAVPYSVRGSTGLVVVEPDMIVDPETVLRQADLAMYQAKQVGGTLTVYQPGLSGPGTRSALQATVVKAARHGPDSATDRHSRSSDLGR